MTAAHVSRMLVERYELMKKVEALNQFITSNPIFVALDPDEQLDQLNQLHYMREYLSTLESRIHRAEYQAPTLSDYNPQTMPPPDHVLAAATPALAPAGTPAGDNPFCSAPSGSDSGGTGSAGADCGSAASAGGDAS